MGTFPAEDFRLLVAEAVAIGASSALEFGPGDSTLAFVEARCRRILTLEHTDRWRAVATRRFERLPHVEVGRYCNEPTISAGTGDRFDLAFVDSPVGVEARRLRHPGQEDCSRLNTVLCALKHAPVVLLHDAHRPGERATLKRVEEMGWRVLVHPTARGLARIWRPC